MLYTSLKALYQKSKTGWGCNMVKCVRCKSGVLNTSFDGEAVCMMCGHVTYPKLEVNSRRKQRAIQLVEKFGVTETAKLMELPTSTIGLWTKGHSKKEFRGTMYQDEDFKREVAEYAIQHHNNYKTAKVYGVSRGSVQNWVKEYKETLDKVGSIV